MTSTHSILLGRNLKRLLLLLPLMMMLAACGPSHMVKKEEPLDIMTVKPKTGKAALVIARTTSFGGAVNFFTHLDKKFIGVTKGKGCFIKTDIEPGLQYLITRTESLETGKIQFEPDTVYYVQQTPRMGWWVARVTLTPVTAEHLASEIGNDGCTFYELDPTDPYEDLSDHEYKEAVTDYEREITEGYHKEFTEYKGRKVQ
ncbi:hypothetical protein GeomeDRAFT_2772 [Geobacter metallireducens RCH3]|uniref:Lipoprotein, putative n=1 Tax=Geobacter metallireducens (strain ATCC 53774 / DSM 7210 / GS-15) TaxID=269799 RepID=Q39UZ1_GEOMG|nr:hypothetical protein [Geobacter metallireducens]ABB31933.1 lipoprotein, putative [Geobacter metallireducens GS-15]EHP84965.1 hypothetical protein GeomeDRAFT_2772 [Geobacter metallireducens RCH3]